MKVVSCVLCGILFDILNARWCEGHKVNGQPRNVTEKCKVCPFGHPLHDLPGWQDLPRREPFEDEKEHGFTWALRGRV